MLTAARTWTGQWEYEVGDDAFRNDVGGTALVFAVDPAKVLAFGKGAFSHTRHVPRRAGTPPE